MTEVIDSLLQEMEPPICQPDTCFYGSFVALVTSELFLLNGNRKVVEAGEGARGVEKVTVAPICQKKKKKDIW